jgi:hypothetical protein
MTSSGESLRAGDSSISFLSSCIPDLSLDFSSVGQSDSSGGEFNSDGGDVILGKGSLDISVQLKRLKLLSLPIEQVSLSDTGISN